MTSVTLQRALSLRNAASLCSEFWNSFYPQRWQKTIILASAMMAIVLSAGAQSIERGEPDLDELSEFIKAQHETPEAFVANMFDDYDIIFLAERHYAENNLHFMQNLLPSLYEAGVYNLVWELMNSTEQERLDRLLTSEAYDEDLAKYLSATFFQGWAYQEYQDVFRAAWELNQSLPDNAKKFRIVAMNLPEPIDEMAPGKRDPATRNAAYGGAFWNVINTYFAVIIDREVIQKGEKALVFSARGHAYTRFFNNRQKAPGGNGVSAGNLIYDYLGRDRVASINLNDTADFSNDLRMSLEDTISNLPEHLQRFGIRTADSPIGTFPVNRVGYVAETQKASDFTLADTTDGYIYLGSPACEKAPVNVIPNFADENTMEILGKRFAADFPRDEPFTADEINQYYADFLDDMWNVRLRKYWGCDPIE